MSMKKKLAIILGAISCVVCIAVAVTVGVLVVGGDDEPTYYSDTILWTLKLVNVKINI